MVNIIGLSGRKESGKSTVARIIKCLTAYYNEQHRSAYDGPISFTKTIFEDWLSNEWIVDDLSEWQIKSFAYKIKQITCILIGCTMEQLEDPEFKEKPLGKEWWKIELIGPAGQVEYKPYSTHQECFEEEFQKRFGVKEINTIKMTPRRLMQLLGTECGRGILHPSIWINALFTDYKPLTYEASEMSVKEGKPTYEYVLSKWVISDVRFPDEFDAVKRRNGIVVRITDGKCRDSLEDFLVTYPDKNVSTKAVQIVKNSEGSYSDMEKELRQIPESKEFDDHESETALDNHSFDYTIINDGGIPDLIERVHDMLKHFKVIKP